MNQLPGPLASAVVASLRRSVGIRQTAVELGVSRGTVQRYAKAIGHNPDPHSAMKAQALPGCTNEERALAARVRRQRAATSKRARYGPPPMTTDDDANALAMTVQRLDRALAAAEANVKRLERASALASRKLKVTAKKRKAEQRALKAAAPALLAETLDERLRFVLAERFAGRTLREIGVLVGLSPSAVRILIRDADAQQSVSKSALPMSLESGRHQELAELIAEQEKDDRTRQVKYEPELPYAVTGQSRSER